MLLALCVAGVSIWAAFFAYATNQEKLTSSVVKQILSELRECPELVEALGEGIRFEPAWWLNGDPWITGSVSNCHLYYRGYRITRIPRICIIGLWRLNVALLRTNYWRGMLI